MKKQTWQEREAIRCVLAKARRIGAEVKQAKIEGLEQIVSGGPYMFPSRKKLEALIVKFMRKRDRPLGALPIEELIETIVKDIHLHDERHEESRVPWQEEILTRYYVASTSFLDRVRADLDTAAASGELHFASGELDMEKVIEIGTPTLREVQKNNTERYEAKSRVYQAVAADVVLRYRKATYPAPDLLLPGNEGFMGASITQ